MDFNIGFLRLLLGCICLLLGFFALVFLVAGANDSRFDFVSAGVLSVCLYIIYLLLK